ncbi:MAG TPA: MBL fold metallo-hydrolase [Cytophagaceae bacterium]|jgi:glyoxylase-like metal-dependent hydrolase (beta-lactamase superfamily II)|nr:MBL fold metallo-hydrolase [Cytophagaceae bacterium]
MKLTTINTGLFKLDGGAMFGVVPKTIWQKLNPADENNMCTWAMRCLLIEDQGKLILVDTGIGNKQDKRFFEYYYLHGNDTLEKSILQAGYTPDEITDVVLTHLHFDHCGGAVNYNSDKTKAFPAFKNATYWSNQEHWKWATEPNPREKASFLKENIFPIQESGQLKFIEQGSSPFPSVDFLMVDGHTEKQMLPIIRHGEKTIVYVADLIPSSAHLPIPYVMGYDTRPLLSMDEKNKFLREAVEKKYILFFEHDPDIECGSLVQTEKGVRMKEGFKLSEL